MNRGRLQQRAKGIILIVFLTVATVLLYCQTIPLIVHSASAVAKVPLLDRNGITSNSNNNTVISSSNSSNRTNGKIAFVSDRDDNPEIYTMNADGTKQTRLTNNNATDDEPNWSPDGAKMAFERDGDIYVMNIDDDTNPTRLANGHSISWSPDGEE